VAELASIDPQFLSYVDARDGIKGQLEDLAFFLRSYSDTVDASPARLQQVDDRLALLERLKRKYGPTLDEVIDKGRALAHERDLLTGAGEHADELKVRLQEATDRYLSVARELSARRRVSAQRFARELEALLGELAMGGTRFEMRFNSAELRPDEWNETGIDRAEFYVSPNPGEELRPLARIVSGGELSRVMLALKTMAAGNEAEKTLIFDEVDAGIGGRVAEVVGTRLRALGDRFQVVCITHLPQIAARATTHFRIEKHIRANRTVTAVERLPEAERVEEIARMVGGATVSDPARAAARELLGAPAGPLRPATHSGRSEPVERRGRPRPTSMGRVLPQTDPGRGESERRKRK
jgi:DNA repair protein RecN (Recombination protein N)